MLGRNSPPRTQEPNDMNRDEIEKAIELAATTPLIQSGIHVQSVKAINTKKIKSFIKSNAPVSLIQDNQDNRYVGAKLLQVQAKSTNALKCLDYLHQIGVAFCWATDKIYLGTFLLRRRTLSCFLLSLRRLLYA